MKKKLLTLSTVLFLTSVTIGQINVQHLISNTANINITQTTATKNVTKAQAQPAKKCATPILSNEYENWVQKEIAKQQQFVNLKTTSVVYTIPVIFHIIHNGQAVGGTRNISQAQVNSQITVLNNDFRKTNSDFSTHVTQSSFVAAAADCEINFCAAKVSPTGAVLIEPGIERINTVTKGWTAPPHQSLGNDLENIIKPNSSWDPNKYLNIWVTELTFGVLGYAQFPTVPSSSTPSIGDMFNQGGAANTDGVVFDYRCVGTVGSAGASPFAPYNKGRTAVHEIGHWLGLRHIDGDSPCGNDFVSDTPAQSDLTLSCPSTDASVVNSGCGASPNPPGRNYQNYMDYTEDKCLTMFTTGQKARMQACMANCTRRTSLNTSTVCTTFVGLEELNSITDVSVFPNPTQGDLSVSISVANSQDFTISVINTLGQTVKEIKQNQSNGGIFKIDLSNSPAGIYFVTFKSKNHTKTKRIVLQ